MAAAMARPGYVSLAVALWLLAAAAPAAPLPLVRDGLVLDCRGDGAPDITCDYRLRDGGVLDGASARRGATTVAVTLGAPTAAPELALLVLVDTSDPRRAAAVAAARRDLADFFAAPPAGIAAGLAAFDTELDVLAPVGSEPAVLTAALAGLQAGGLTTELYRNTGDAIALLAAASAPRKALLLLSDGLAEDRAYHHADVVQRALAARVAVHAIGYPASIAESVALQTLRRLADETGGLYLPTTAGEHRLPADFLPRVVAVTRDGGTLRFTPPADADGPVTLDLVQAGRHYGLELPLALAPVAAVTSVPPAPVAVAAAPPIPAAAAAPPPTPPPARGWSGTALVAALVLAIAAMAAALGLRRRRAPPVDTGVAPVAYFIVAGNPPVRHGVTRLPYRIGRSHNADLRLDDHSVSRLHAELRRHDDGALTLHDLESLNGVFVNDNRVDAIQLREGDLVDIGDLRLTFTLHDEHYAREDATVLVRTHTPM